MDILNSLFLLAVFWVFLDLYNSMYIALQSNIKPPPWRTPQFNKFIRFHTPHAPTILIDLYEDDIEQQKTMYTYK